MGSERHFRKVLCAHAACFADGNAETNHQKIIFVV
jgi:hypothetical protein